jgi:hypothetical protein
MRVQMATDQQKIRSLYAELDLTSSVFGLMLIASWLFAAFSYYLSRETGADWFSRSGSVMGLLGAVATFRLVRTYQRALVIALKEGLVSVSREIELSLEPPTSYQILSYFGYVTGVVGTGIWGYGDLLLRAGS